MNQQGAAFLMLLLPIIKIGITIGQDIEQKN